MGFDRLTNHSEVRQGIDRKLRIKRISFVSCSKICIFELMSLKQELLDKTAMHF